MYRLSEIHNSLIQKLVSNEILRGFAAVLCTDFETDLPDSEAVILFISRSEVLTRLTEQHPEAEPLLTCKLASMVAAVKDRKYEYTFDEFGEFLLYEMIQQSKEDFPDWIPGGTYYDHEELSELIHSWAEDIAQDLGEEDAWTKEQQKELEQNTLNAVLYFPNLADELREETIFCFLFWDIDFMMFYEYDFNQLNDWMVKNKNLGFSGNRMTKYPLEPEI